MQTTQSFPETGRHYHIKVGGNIIHNARLDQLTMNFVTFTWVVGPNYDRRSVTRTFDRRDVQINYLPYGVLSFEPI